MFNCMFYIELMYTPFVLPLSFCYLGVCMFPIMVSLYANYHYLLLIPLFGVISYTYLYDHPLYPKYYYYKVPYHPILSNDFHIYPPHQGYSLSRPTRGSSLPLPPLHSYCRSYKTVECLISGRHFKPDE